MPGAFSPDVRVTAMRSMPRLSPEQARRRGELAARALAADPRVRLVFLFGSAADPHRTLPVRDVDLAVLTDPPLGLDELLSLRADVARAAGGDVDLVLLNTAPVVLAHEVVASGCCLYADPPEEEAELVARTHMKYLDFKHFLDEQWRLAGERLEARTHGPQA